MKRYTEFCVVDVDGDHVTITFTTQVWKYLGTGTQVFLQENEYISRGSLGIAASGQLGAVRVPFPISGDVLSVDRATRSDWSMQVHIVKPDELDILSTEPIALEE